MSWFPLRRRDRHDRESAEELASYIDHETDLNIERGMSPEDARAAAFRKLGNPTRIREEMYEMFSVDWLEGWWRDLRQGARSLRRSRTFTLTAAVTLALGIGANTAVFSVSDAVLLRPLPFPQPERLVQVVVHFKAQGKESHQVSHAGRAWEVLREGITTADLVACKMGAGGVNLATGAGAEYVRQQRVGAGFFRILGVPPLIGREFTGEEDRPGGPPVAVLSHSLWRRRFSSDPAIVGRSILLKGEPHTVVGVVPESFQSTANADLWTPIRPSAEGEGGGMNYSIIGRLRDGVTWAAANGQLAQVGSSLLTKANTADSRAEFRFLSLQDGLTQDTRRPILLLLGTVGIVLLICCVNLAGLLLARCAARSREMATRLALGGGRSHVFRQMIAESLLLAALGGALGLALGTLGTIGLSHIARQTYDIWQPVSLDLRVLCATAGVALLTSLVFGLAPAMYASRTDIREALAGGASRASTAGRHWPGRLLVVAEISLSVVLLAAAGLLIRTFAHLNTISPGFDGSGVLTASLSLDDARYHDAARVVQFYRDALGRLSGTPGIEFAAAGLTLPDETALNTAFRLPDSPRFREQWLTSNVIYVTPEYFRVLRIRLLRGREFRDSDTAESQPVTIVNESFVRRYLGDSEPLGRRIDGKTEVVGVVADVRHASNWGNFGPLAPAPAMYVPAAQMEGEALKLFHTWFSPSLLVRSSAPSAVTMQALRDAVAKVDPELPVASFRTLDEIRARTLVRQRMQAVLLAVMAALALLLSGVGLYGLVAHSVVERTREFGIRMALGATKGRVLSSVIASGMTPAICGVLLGAVLARAAARLLSTMIWGIPPGDPLTFAGVVTLLLLVAAVASSVPALKVLGLDPARVLRLD